MWLEGGTDYPMFEPLARSMNCVLRPAGGVEECRKLARAMMKAELPYIVVMDGDYEILRRQRSRHRRVVLLARHSIENYCAEPELLERVCRGYSQGEVTRGVVGAEFARLLGQLESELKELVALDIACIETGEKVLEGSILSLLVAKPPPVFDQTRIKRVVREKERCDGDGTGRKVAGELLARFLARRRFVDILQGHWVFQLIRWFMVRELKRVEVKMQMDDKGLRMVFAAEMWGDAKLQDHASLRRRLRRAILEARRMRTAGQ